MIKKYKIGEMVCVRSYDVENWRVKENNWIGVVINKRKLRSDIVYDVYYNEEIKVVDEDYLWRVK
jgi:hypothetical protein